MARKLVCADAKILFMKHTFWVNKNTMKCVNVLSSLVPPSGKLLPVYCSEQEITAETEQPFAWKRSTV